MKAIDNAITAWFHHLPDGQEQIDMLDFNDRTDELLFQAHMLINYATMYLHFPRSDLVPALPAARDVIREKFLLPTSSQHMHALKPISASKCLDSLASYPPSVRKHSPFFICCVVFSIIVQLSACAANLPDSYDKHWDQIKLIMVVLKTLGRIWGLARATLKKIKRMTVEVFHEVATYPEDQIDDSRDSGIGYQAKAVARFYAGHSERLPDIEEQERLEHKGPTELFHEIKPDFAEYYGWLTELAGEGKCVDGLGLPEFQPHWVDSDLEILSAKSKYRVTLRSRREYKSQFPTPTGNPADPTLTSHGVRQSLELAEHLVSPEFSPKPFRIYSSPFYRCLQTIQPSVEALKERHNSTPSSETGIDRNADLDVRIENGVGEWFGPTSFFDHPSPASPGTLKTHFPTLLASDPEANYNPHLLPSTRGETIAQLHDRVATALAGIIADVDAEIDALEAPQPPAERTSKAILICAHAAPLIAMGRVLTGNMPDDADEEDFNVFTAGLSTFVRRKTTPAGDGSAERRELAPGTRVIRSGTVVPDWQDGKGVSGGWDCVVNGDCSFLSGGAERGWHFNGEESFDTGPMAPSSALPTSSQDTSTEMPSTKL
ncbi:Histidine phosphatase superfamily branch 1 [Aspergillus parasiticus SU-1]|uniref:Histidine phosphatase superfamily branch 1 n=1 Tax=Aspergillus parasiticus (strain ATCC 56775 / NRRL 5862 / SRRC 143 / SU-1) TaxID=1403190 RepID=A0A0F0I6T1_ASPPU|nr:Histidine phosphatase superfamily branch 1 [Aspergillus parasiticus SU-1]